MFSAFHAGSTWRQLRERLSGEATDIRADSLLADFRELRSAMQRDGMFESSKAYYVWKVRWLPHSRDVSCVTSITSTELIRTASGDEQLPIPGPGTGYHRI